MKESLHTDPIRRVRIRKMKWSIFLTILASVGPQKVVSGHASDEEVFNLHHRTNISIEELWQKQRRCNTDQPHPLTHIDPDEIYSKYFENPDGSLMTSSVPETLLIALSAENRYADYLGVFGHRYDSLELLRSAAGPETDQELCIKQLRLMNERAEHLSEITINSTDVEMYRLLDTYGKVPPGILVGNIHWLGSFKECIRLKIHLENKEVGTKFCWAGLRHESWPSSDVDKLENIKSGVCLPKSCDSLWNEEKYLLIEKLMMQASPDTTRHRFKMTDLYCLPDEDSPLRIWYLQPATLASVTLLATWLLVLVYCTYVYESSLRVECGTRAKGNSKGYDLCTKIITSLAITRNMRNLLEVESNDLPVEKRSSKARPSRVKLDMIVGIKTLSMYYIVTSHVLMLMGTNLANKRDLNLFIFSPPYLLTHMLPAFFVDPFFALAAMLMTYTMFKKNEHNQVLTSPREWLVQIVRRYLRLAPLYVVFTMFLKYIFKFIGSGPYWDYGTTTLGPGRRCEEESWFWVIFMVQNFKNPMQHCVPSGWFLGNDLQFLMVSPIFLYALHRNKELGRQLLKISILATCAYGMYATYVYKVEDVKPVASLKPHGFKVFQKELSMTYSQPQFRIFAYLLGILIGHIMYCIDRDANKSQAEGDKPKEELPLWFKKRGAYLCGSFYVIFFLLPIATANHEVNDFEAKISVSVLSSLLHLLSAAAAGFYVLLASSGFGNKTVDWFLSAYFWRVSSKMSLSIMLVNIQTIAYFVQVSTNLGFLDTGFLYSMDLICMTMSYMVGSIVFILLESPLSGLTHELLEYLLLRGGIKQKRA